MIKKLFFTLSLIFLFVFLCIEQSAFSVIGICFLLILILIIDEIIVRKKTKHSFKPNTTDLDNLENSKIYRTDQDGSIMFKIKNNKLKVETCSP